MNSKSLTRLFSLSMLLLLLSFSSVNLHSKITIVPTCLEQFQYDWSFCASLGCDGFWDQLTSMGSCHSNQLGCEKGALNRYDNCIAGI
jgi:hypothetical protein